MSDPSKKSRFRQWMDGDKDPFLGKVEMKEAVPQENYEEFYQSIDEAGLIKDVRESTRRDANKLTLNTVVYRILSVIACAAFVLVLVYGISFLPVVGEMSNPTNNEVSARYIESGLQETGSVNIVTGMILTYRAFDTFGETTVLFISTCCVMLLLMIEKLSERNRLKLDQTAEEPKNDPILQTVAKFLCPVIFMFGIYVILNGHLSPGGGFSGGSILGAGMILYAAAFGFDNTQRWFNEHIYVIIKVTALMAYGLIAIYFFVTGANGLPSIFPAGVPGAILSGGIILPIDICVGTEVACTIYAFYALFRRGGL